MLIKLEERGVSPVVGTILLLVLTIILVSILAGFVMSMTQEKMELIRTTVENIQKTLNI